MKINKKKSAISQVISIFIIILVVSVLAGLTFLFVSELKDQVIKQELTQQTTNSETAFANASGYQVYAFRNDDTARTFALIGFWNSTHGIELGNVTLGANDGILYNATSAVFENGTYYINYTYYSAINSTAYRAVNDTEDAGATLVNYLPLVFIALIFGVVLAVVLRIILPYINLGQRVGQF